MRRKATRRLIVGLFCLQSAEETDKHEEEDEKEQQNCGQVNRSESIGSDELMMSWTKPSVTGQK
jgi:hypothetical protein